jgi:Predicted membrane protein (DUF2142)
VIPTRDAIVRAIRRPSSTSLKVSGAVAMLVAFACWAIASPVGASPDEDYHLASIWCAHGTEAGICESTGDAGTRRVPEQLIVARCYSFHGDMTASCQTEQLRGLGMVATDRGNWVGLYPPVYYYVMGLFVSHDVTNSVIVMRLMNALLFVGLLAALYALLPAGLRRPMVAGALITIVPLGAFLVPSINPSGWAILSAATLLVSLLGYLTATDRRRRIGLGALAALSLLIGSGARADAAAYALVAIGVAVILTVRFRALDVRRMIFPGVLGVLAALAFLSVGQSGALGVTEAGAAEPATIFKIVNTALEVPSLLPGALGGWPLGWLDTGLPSTVWIGCWTAFVAVIFVAVDQARVRGRIAAGLVLLTTLALPTYMLMAWGLHVGELVQPRYLLPLLILLAVTTMVQLDGEAFRLTGVQRSIVLALLIISNTVALHMNIKRYVVGVDGLSLNLNRDVEWWWQIPLSPMMTWLIGAGAFAIAAILLTREFVVAANATDTGPVVAHPPADDESVSGGLLALGRTDPFGGSVTGDSVPAVPADARGKPLTVGPPPAAAQL